MISEVQANDIAVKYLEKLSLDMGVEIRMASIEVTEDGYLVGFNTKEFLETGRIGSALAGNIPFLIDKDNGKVRDVS